MFNFLVVYDYVVFSTSIILSLFVLFLIKKNGGNTIVNRYKFALYYQLTIGIIFSFISFITNLCIIYNENYLFFYLPKFDNDNFNLWLNIFLIFLHFVFLYSFIGTSTSIFLYRYFKITRKCYFGKKEYIFLFLSNILPPILLAVSLSLIFINDSSSNIINYAPELINQLNFIKYETKSMAINMVI